MVIIKHCPNCGFELEEGMEFCSECGFDLKNDIKHRTFVKEEKSFFNNLKEKTSFPVFAFSFVIFGIFLFVGAFFWSSFLSSGSLDLITYLMLVIVFSVFFSAIFVGYWGCKNRDYVVPNFSVFLASIYAVVLCGVGLIFSILMGVFSALSSVFSSMGGNSLYGSSYQPSTPSYVPSIDLSGFLKIVLFIMLIPVAAYIGVYLGYFLRENI